VSTCDLWQWPFTQEDPIGIAGGLNLYGYANGDPINFSDPFGLSADTIQHQAHEVKGVPGTQLHESFRIVPDDQEAWKNHPAFSKNYQETGVAFATLGAGPVGTRLVGQPNRPTDIASNGLSYTLSLGGRDENQVIGLMLAYDQLFPDNSLYGISGYTSNSYTRGMAVFSGITPFPYSNTPGSGKPFIIPRR
jgi:uncharacterized protein RhaS with RHS repeats